MATSRITINKPTVIAVLAFIFLLAFIITPYWMLPSNLIKRIFILAISLGIGSIWIHVSSSRLYINWELKKLFPFALLLVSLFVVNFNSLTSVLPWRGDEDYHVSITLNLVNRIPSIAGYIIPFFIIIFVIAALMKPKLGLFIGLIVSLTMVLIHFLWNPLHGLEYIALSIYQLLVLCDSPFAKFSVHNTLS